MPSSPYITVLGGICFNCILTNFWINSWDAPLLCYVTLTDLTLPQFFNKNRYLAGWCCCFLNLCMFLVQDRSMCLCCSSVEYPTQFWKTKLEFMIVDFGCLEILVIREASGLQIFVMICTLVIHGLVIKQGFVKGWNWLVCWSSQKRVHLPCYEVVILNALGKSFY